MKTGVYKITNIISSKVYIGSALNIYRRWSIHKNQLYLNIHHSIKLQRSYNIHGKDNFKFEILEECDKNKLIEVEQKYIDLYDSYMCGYNSNPKAGNSMGRKASEETKNKMSLNRKGKIPWNKGITPSDETRLKLSIAGKGRKHTDEAKKKISESKIGKKRSESVILKLKNRKISLLTREKISKAKKGKKLSESHIKIIKIRNTGRKNPKYNPTPVIQYDLSGNLIKEWKDLLSTKEGGFNSKSISQVCRGNRNKYNGYYWKFKD